MTDEFVKHKDKKKGKNEEKMNVEEEELKQETSDEKTNIEENSENLSNDSPEVKNELSDLENQYKRLLADFKNLQKRTVQEKEDIHKFAGQKTLESLLPALDTFDYAKAALNPDTDVEKLIKDFNLVFEMFMKCFAEMGIKPIDETGIPFDPNIHEPMQQIPTNELPEHTVMQIIKRGYMVHDRVIRPAMVAVSIEENKSEESNK